jgi:hypothetical protein
MTRKKRKKSESEEVVKIIDPTEAIGTERVSIEKLEPSLRFYVKIIGDFVSVYTRNTHDYVLGLKNDFEGKQAILKLLNMSQLEYYNYLSSIGYKNKTREITSWSTSNPRYIENESWFNSVWYSQTDKYFESLGVPIESMFEHLV